MSASSADIGNRKSLSDVIVELETIVGDGVHDLVRGLMAMNEPELRQFAGELSVISRYLTASADRAAAVKHEEKNDANAEADLLTPGEIDSILEKLEEEIKGIQLTADTEGKPLSAY